MLNESDLLALVETAGVLLVAPVIAMGAWWYYVVSCFRTKKP